MDLLILLTNSDGLQRNNQHMQVAMHNTVCNPSQPLLNLRGGEIVEPLALRGGYLVTSSAFHPTQFGNY